MAEKVLPYERGVVPQETGYWCGPASTQVILNSRNITVAERDLAREMGTHTGGTDYIGLIERVLDRVLPDARYTSVYVENDPMTASQKDRLWEHVVGSINAGFGVSMNWVAPPHNYPRGVNGSASPAYGGGTVYHYVACMGYDDSGDRALWIADSGFRPFGYWVSFDQAASLIPPKGYAYASVKGAVSVPDVPKPLEPEVDAVAVLAAATGLTKAAAKKILPTVQQGLRLSGCTNVLRIATWLAQIGHESAFKYTEEIAKNGRYAPYIGRTWIQITWEANYRSFSQWAFDNGLVDSPDFFVNDYKALADLRWAGIGPAWYWTVARTDINELCDRGEFDTVTYRINGGQNGAADRRARYDRALAQGDKLLTLVQEGNSSDEELLMSDRLYPSVSLYKNPGEGARYTLAQLIQSIDGFAHREAVEDAALQGSLSDIEKIFRVAAGQGEFKDAWAVNHAKTFLVRLEQENRSALEAYRLSKGIA
jgi:predicted chitinase